MRRVAIVFGVVALLVLADGIYQNASNYDAGNQNQIFSTHLNVPDGTTMIISGLVLGVVAGLMWWQGAREARRSRGLRSGPGGAE